jgi:hypothetical protein
MLLRSSVQKEAHDKEMDTCAGYFGYTFSKKTVNSKVSNYFASCAMEIWRVKDYKSAIGTGIWNRCPQESTQVGLRAEPKGSTPQPTDKGRRNLGSGKQEEKR